MPRALCEDRFSRSAPSPILNRTFHKITFPRFLLKLLVYLLTTYSYVGDLIWPCVGITELSSGSNKSIPSGDSAPFTDQTDLRDSVLHKAMPAKRVEVYMVRFFADI